MLSRNLSLLVADDKGMNIVHHAIEMEKIDFLAYMLEGEFSFPKDSEAPNDQECYMRAKAIFEKIRSKKFPWIIEALYALEVNNKKKDSCLHMAIEQENKTLFIYLITMLKVRDHLRTLDKARFWDYYQRS